MSGLRRKGSASPRVAAMVLPNTKRDGISMKHVRCEDAEVESRDFQPIAPFHEMTMRRVLVIGSGGAGKSTVAAQISDRLGLQIIHLDAFYWRPGWVETPKEEWEHVVGQLLQREAWVMDGNYGGTLDLRLAAADTVIFLDLPRLLCLWRVVKRWAQFHGGSRPDVARGCPERLTVEFVRWIWTYPQERRPRILDKLQAVEQEKQIVLLHSTAAVRRFVRNLPNAE